MKQGFRFLVSFVATLLFFSSCKKEGSPAASNTLYSFGFDDDNDSSFEGWTSDSHQFTNDTPPDGGNWALELTPGLIPEEGLAETSVNLASGSYNLKLSADTKVTNPGTDWIRLLLQHSGGSRDTLVSKSFTKSDWQNISVTAPADITPGDEIIIQLSAGSSEVPTWNALFDNVELEKE